MKKYLTFSILLVLTACQQAKQPDCNDQNIRQTVLDIYHDDLVHYLDEESSVLKMVEEEIPNTKLPVSTIHPDTIVASFLKNSVLVLNKTATNKKNEDSLSCDCRGQLHYNLSEAFMTEFNNNMERTQNDKIYFLRIKKLGDLDLNIKYSVKLDQNGLPIVTTSPLEDLRKVVDDYTLWYSINKTALLRIKNLEKDKPTPIADNASVPLRDNSENGKNTVTKESKVKKKSVPRAKQLFVKHVVAEGETMYSIAKMYTITVMELEEANPVLKTSRLTVGYKLDIPVEE